MQISTISHYIVAISFIGGGNRSTRRKPPTCQKSPRHEWDSNSQL